MSVSWTVKDGIAHLVSEDVASFEDWRLAVDALLDDDDIALGRLDGVVHDWRKLTRTPAKSDVESRARYLDERVRIPIRWAVVARPADLDMARMKVRSLTRVECEVFRDPPAAEAWVRARGIETPVASNAVAPLPEGTHHLDGPVKT